MSMQGRIGRAGGFRVKRALAMQAILEWAFRVEKAQVELPVRRDIDEEGFGCGMEYVLIQRARLGCKVDGGGNKSQSYTHEDAEIVAATLAGLPDSLGGKRMAIYISELARAGMTPDWMPGAMPRCVPVATKLNQHGERTLQEAPGDPSRDEITEEIDSINGEQKDALVALFWTGRGDAGPTEIKREKLLNH